MKKITNANILLAVVALVLVAVSAYASPSTRRTKITFDGPVRVPGTVLQAGTYYFQAPLTNNRTVVRITDESGKHVTKLMGIADFTRKRDHDVILFGENECGPKAIKSWFYPHSSTGVRFIYPKDEAEAIASACNEPVPEIHETQPNVAQLRVYRVYLITPQKKEKEYKQEDLAASDEADQNGVDGEAAQEPKAAKSETPHKD